MQNCNIISQPGYWHWHGYTGNILIFIFIFKFFYGCTHSIWKFPGLGSNQSCSRWPVSQPQQCQITHRICDLNHSSGAGSLTHRARPAIKPSSSWTLCQVLNPLSHNRNSSIFIFKVHILLHFFFLFVYSEYVCIFNWNKVDLQYYISFRCTAYWFQVFIDYIPFVVIIKYWLYSEYSTIYSYICTDTQILTYQSDFPFYLY